MKIHKFYQVSFRLTTLQKYLFSQDNTKFKSSPTPNGALINRVQNPFRNNDVNEDLLTPRKVVQYLDKFVIGQGEAKKAVAISFRNRWRRKNLPLDLRSEITPKNLLIQGPTGSGKSEIARRLAKLTDAPFLRVQATKYTQVGYVGKDVSSIIEDTHDKFLNEMSEKIKDQVYKQILNAMLGDDWSDKEIWDQKFNSLKQGHFDEQVITIFPGWKSEFLASLGLEIPFPPQRPMTKPTVQIFNILYSVYYDKLKFVYSNIDITKEALKNVEEQGIIFLDQIDKLASPNSIINTGKGVSTEGVQRDLLPIIEGTVINTKFGEVKTDHILFIASGSFSMAKVDDLIPELLGRLPIRVNLNPISLEDFVRILTQPEFNLLMQQTNLFKSEKVDLKFETASIRTMAEYAYNMNQNTENIGARRLHAVVEKVLEDISFDAPERKGELISINESYVVEKLQKMNTKLNLAKYLI